MTQRYSTLKRILSYGKLVALFQVFFGLPHLFLAWMSPIRSVIERDVRRWLENAWQHQEMSRLSTWRGLTWLVWAFPEFRSLFYYRITCCEHLPSRLLLVLVRWFLPPMPTLYFYTPTIGPGLYIQHGFSTVVAARSLGENCWIQQQVTVGWKDEEGCPTIGNNVRIAAGAIVFGNIAIGDNVVIGANALVCKNVPAGCTVVGVPAYIVRRDGKSVREEL